MFRLLLVVSVLLLGSLIAQTPNSQLPAPTAMELTDTHVIAEHTDNGHLSCDFSCLGCSHSVHDMCPDTLLTRSTSRHHHTAYPVRTTVQQGYRNSLLRPPINLPLQLV